MAGKGAIESLAGIVIFMMAVMGMVNWWKDDALEEYHNGFVQGAYREILGGAWNDLVREFKSDDVSDERVAALLRDALIPRCKRWLEEADKGTPPSFAAPFHGRFRSGIEVLAKDAEKLAAAIAVNDTDRTRAILEHMGPMAERIHQEVVQLQESLKSERKFTFEEKRGITEP